MRQTLHILLLLCILHVLSFQATMANNYSSTGFAFQYYQTFKQKVTETLNGHFAEQSIAFLMPPPSGTVSVRINAGSDDAEESVSSGAITTTSTDLELAVDGATSQLVGMRFNGVAIPSGATITSAYIEFETDAAQTGNCNLNIQGEDADNPGTFTSVDKISTRTRTTTSVAWNPPDWNTVDEKHQSPDISNIIQEIINRAGWADGNSLVLIIDGTGRREAESYEGEAAAAPLLVVNYTTPTPVCNDIVDSESFESGFGIWNDGGTDCFRRNSNANTGTYSLNLQDNTGTSLATTNTIDLSAYSEIEIRFSFITVGFNSTNHDFWLQLSSDGGANFTTVEEWNYNDEFVNNTRYNETVSITGPFTSNIQVRFRCHAQNNNDDVYLDDIEIVGCNIPEICNNGIDDDGDGLTDCDDPDCAFISNPEFDSGTTDWALYQQTGSTATFSIDNTSQLSGANSAYLDVTSTSGTSWHLQLAQINHSIEAGETYTVSFLARAAASRSVFVHVQLRESPWNDYWGESVNIGTSPAFYSYTFTASATSNNVGLLFDVGATTDDVWIDNVHFGGECPVVPEICGNGIDDDGDTLVDCADPDCEVPSVTSISSTNPSNCPTPNNGQITIAASGSNLEYSINNGTSYQTGNSFSGLSAGSYTIIVRNSVSGCEQTYGSNPVLLTGPSCVEICGNGIDDDGDTLVDCADPDCEVPTVTSLSSTNPSNCPTPNNGQIIISASGSNLEYSINNGTSYQTGNSFSGLSAGSYTIIVRNSVSGCEQTYGSNPVLLTGPSCVEICGNGIDDDGDTFVDCDDSDCSGSIVTDTDGDGINDLCDVDDDNDGILDEDELECSGATDFNFSSLATSSNQTIAQLESIINGSSVNINGSLMTIDVTQNGNGKNEYLQIQDNHHTNVYGIYARDYDNPTYSDAISYTYTFDQALSDFSFKVLDVDDGDAVEVYGFYQGVVTPFTYTLYPSTVVTYEGNNQFSSPANTESSTNEDLGTIDFDFTGNMVDSIVVKHWDIDPHGTITMTTYSAPCAEKDTDGDDIPDPRDPDSDNDGCPDAIEGAGSFTSSDIDGNNRLTGGVDANGMPTVAGASGQGAAAAVTDAGLYACLVPEICGNGIDDDGDTLVDCADPDCDVPSVTSMSPTNPTNCLSLSDGQIIITASGSNLEYSINNGISYQTGNTFIALSPGSYTIIVRNSATGCEQTYGSNPVVLTGPSCPEICDNGVDDDGDGLIDCNDPDCNSIANQEFDAGTTSWDTYIQSGAAATLTVDNTSQLSGTNAGFIDIAATNGNNWDIQLAQPGKSIESGKIYNISFEARAAANRNIYVSVQETVSPYTDYGGQTISLGTTANSYSFDIAAGATNSGNVGLYFHLGANTTDVWIDNVFFGETCPVFPEICGNGIDDDGDGLIDAADPDCPTPFICDSKFYQTMEVAGEYWLYEIATDPVQLTPLVNITTTGGISDDINGVVFNKNDGYIYFIELHAPHNLYRMGGDYTIVNLGPVTGFPGSFYPNSAGIGNDGTIYYRHPWDSDIFLLDMSTLTVSLLCDHPTWTAQTRNVGDLALNPLDGKYYGTRDSTSVLISYDLNNCDTSVTTLSQWIDGALGAFYIAADGTGYGYANNTGNLYQIDLATGQVQVVGTGAPTTETDGCSCEGIKFTKDVNPGTVTAGNSATYTFTIYNNWNTPLTNIAFRDTLTQGLLWNSEPYNLTGGITIGTTSILGTANGEFTITNLPIGTTSFQIDASTPLLYSGTVPHYNQAYLENFPSLLASFKPSDYPGTPKIDDPTPLIIYASFGNLRQWRGR